MTKSFFRNLLLLSLALSVPACSLLAPSAPAPSEADILKEEQAVYSFFVGSGDAPVLILEETSTDISNDNPQQTIDYIKSGLEGISKDTIDNYLARNEQSTVLSPDMDLGVKYILLSEEELHSISSQPNWGEVLNEKYPGTNGYIIFSHVGFNKSLDQALIYVGNVGGPLMGSGSYYLMEKKNGEWVMIQQIMTWIS